MKGVEKRIDSLGRVVIPKPMRNSLGLSDGSKVFVAYEDGTILIIPEKSGCVLCGNRDRVNQRLPLCDNCIKKIKKLK